MRESLQLDLALEGAGPGDRDDYEMEPVQLPGPNFRDVVSLERRTHWSVGAVINQRSASIWWSIHEKHGESKEFLSTALPTVQEAAFVLRNAGFTFRLCLISEEGPHQLKIC